MYKNKLYRIVQLNMSSTPSTVANIEAVRHRLNKEEHSYFLVELSLDNKFQLDDYTLIGHHISVYENHEEGFAATSQYHYTAYFNDNSGQEYRLHVYFNHHDDLVYKPLFSIKREGDTYEPIECTELETAFKDLANLSISDWVFYIRTTQQNFIEQLEKEYASLDKETESLSLNIEQDKTAYLNALEKQIAKLNELSQYAVATRELSGRHQFLSRLKKSIESEENVLLHHSSSPKEQENIDRILFSSSELAYEKMDAELESPPLLIKNIPFQTILQDLQKRFINLKQLSDEQSITPLNTLFIDLKEVELCLDSYSISVTEIKELRELTKKIQHLGVSFLQRFLLKDQYQKASLLNMFYPYLSKSTVSLALMRDNGALLRFLLNEQIIPTNYKGFYVGNHQYHSLMDYCFKNTNAQSSKADIMDILIKHDSSLLFAKDSNGLPFAAILLLQKAKHPLWPVFEKNSIHTIENKEFINRLHQILSVIRIQKSCSIETKRQIHQILLKNKEEQKSVKLYEAFGGKALVRASNKQIREIKAILGNDEVIEQLKSDPEIDSLNQQIKIKTTSFLSKIPRNLHTKIATESKIDYDSAVKQMRLHQRSAPDVDFFITKTMIMKEQKRILRSLDLNEQLLTIKMEGIQPRHPRNSQKTNQLARRAIEITKELEQLAVKDNKLELTDVFNAMIDYAINKKEQSKNTPLQNLSLFSSPSASSSSSDVLSSNTSELQYSNTGK